MRIAVPCLAERSPWGTGVTPWSWEEVQKDLAMETWWAPGTFCGRSLSHNHQEPAEGSVSPVRALPVESKKGLLLAASYTLWKIRLYLEIPQLFCGQNSYSFQVWVETPNSGPVSELFINASFISPAPCECLVILEARDLICQNPT